MAQRGRSGTGHGPGRGSSSARRPAAGTARAAQASRRSGGARPPSGGRAGARRTRAPRPRGRLTGRAVVLALVFVALILSYAYPVRTYLAQRSELAALTGSQAEQRQRIAGLKAERDKWNDPRYVEAQARDQLQMVRPGDKVYTVYEDPAVAKQHSADRARQARSTGPWYAKLWSSVQVADGRGR